MGLITTDEFAPALKTKVDALGNPASLQTTSKEVVGAVNEVKAKTDTTATNMGDVTGLQTASKLVVSAINEVKTLADQAKTQADNGKTGLANAIGSPAQASDTFDTLNSYVNGSRTTLQSKFGVGNPSDSLVTIANTRVDELRGTLATNIASKGVTASPSETLNALAVKVSSISKGQGNATEGHVLSGVTFSNADGVLRTGTMPNNGAINITPSTSNQSIPTGYTTGGVVAGDTNLVPSNIVKDASIFGVTGTAVLLKAGDSIVYTSAEEKINGDAVYKKVKDIMLTKAGSFRLKFDMRINLSDRQAKAKITVNNVEVGGEIVTNNTNYTTFSRDIVTTGINQHVCIYLYCSGGWAYVNNVRFGVDVGTFYDQSPSNP